MVASYQSNSYADWDNNDKEEEEEEEKEGNEDWTPIPDIENYHPAGTRALESVIEKDMPNKECIICFEGFFVGENATRLDCWCLFHTKCIKEWFDKQECVACPVHKRDTDYGE